MLADESHSRSTPPPQRGASSTLRFHDVLGLGTSTGPWSPALQAAVELAARWNGNVTGCYVPAGLREQRAYDADPTVMSLLADVEQENIDDAVAFQNFARHRGAHSASWTVTRTAIAPTLHKLGAWHDLAVLERDMVDAAHVFDVLGEAMLSSRTPCLVLPPQWSDVLAFDRIVVAWNGTFESTRALRSALPLIQLAREVVLVNGEIHTPYDGQVSVAEPDPIVYLMHHGIAAKPHYIRVPAEEAGGALLQKAREVRADLLVMGAYGHSRIRERVLGGATRQVMAHAGMPVFMQH